MRLFVGGVLLVFGVAASVVLALSVLVTVVDTVAAWWRRRREARVTAADLSAQVESLSRELATAARRANAAEEALRRAEVARQEERLAKRTLRRRWKAAVDEARAWKGAAVGLGWTREEWINKPRRERKESIRRCRAAMAGTGGV